MAKFMKHHNLSSNAFYAKIANTKPMKQVSKSKMSVDARWYILLNKLNKRYMITGIKLPDVNRMKVKKITVKNKG